MTVAPNGAMSTYPDDCPFCGTDITHVRPDRVPAPADVQARRPASRGCGLDTKSVSVRRLAPCGHCFRTADIEAWREGEVPTRALGDRVQNPAPGRD